MATSPSPEDLSSWIENDHLLRDEGVLFGWADEALLEKKVEAIRRYYRQKSEEASRERARLQERETTLRSHLADVARETDAAEARIQDAENRVQQADAADRATYDLLRYGAGVALGVLGCIFNYFVIWFLVGGGLAVSRDTAASATVPGTAGLAPAAGSPFPQPWLVALGIFFLGMFTLFAPVSILYRRGTPGGDPDEAAESGKVWVSELIPAMAAAFFAVVYGEEPTLLHTVASFFFIAALFMFGGKLVLSLLPRVTVAWKRRNAHMQLRIHAAEERNAYHDVQGRRLDLKSQLSEVEERRLTLPSDQELVETCERKIHLFLSEVEFAQAATRHLAAAGH